MDVDGRGLNTFVQYLAERSSTRIPTRRGPARNITELHGRRPKRISPIMTNSESIFQFGPNAYGKPATALNILRETVMGRELFDFAFKEYGRRWAFKRPTPADLFRTMEDASSVDLDWFWRGWFYTNDHVDLALSDIQWYQISTGDPDVEKPLAKAEKDAEPVDIALVRDETYIPESRLEARPELNDHYTTVDPFAVMEIEPETRIHGCLDEDELALLFGQHLLAHQEHRRTRHAARGGIPLHRRHHGPAASRKLAQGGTKCQGVRDAESHTRLNPFLELADTDLSNNGSRNVRPTHRPVQRGDPARTGSGIRCSGSTKPDYIESSKRWVDETGRMRWPSCSP